jgi:hypothetical protein
MLLQLVKGATTVTLSGDGATIAGCTYTPRTPEDSLNVVASNWRNGGEIVAQAKRNVTESVSVILAGSSSVVIGQVRAIEALFPVEEAQRRSASDKLYAQYRQEATGDVYRSEVLAGRVEWSPSLFSAGLASGAVEVTIIWQRRWFWEDTVLRDVPLSNGNGSNVTNGLTIWNHDDSGTGHDNWVSVGAASVGGVIPAPAQIEMETLQDIWLQKMCIGHNVQAAPTSLGVMLEGESSVKGGSNQADANASNGAWRQVSWSTNANGVVIFQWNLSASKLAQMKGNYFRVLARIYSVPSDAYVTVSLRYPTNFLQMTIASTQEAAIQNAYLQDWGLLQIPDLTNTVELALVVAIRSATAGTLTLDFLQLTPVDSWRQWSQIGYDLETGDTYVDDGKRAWWQDGAGLQYPLLIADGNPIVLWPGRDQRLYFLAGGTVSMYPEWQFKVKVKYRPRRLTV